VSLFVLADAHPSRRAWALARQLEEAVFEVWPVLIPASEVRNDPGTGNR
jgi:hypothetical protein